MTLLRLTLVSSIALLTATPSYAQAVIDQAGADEIKAALSDRLQGAAVFLPEFEIKVDVASDGYDAAVIFGKFPLSGFNVEVAPINLHFTPTSTGTYSFTGTIGSPFLALTNDKGLQEGTFTIGQQDINGLWDAKNRLILEENLSLTDIKGADQNGNTLVYFGSFKANLKNRLDELGKLSSIGVSSVRHIEMSAPDMPGQYIKVDGVGFAAISSGTDHAALNALTDKMRADEKNPDLALQNFSSTMKNILAISGRSDVALVINGLDSKIGEVETGQAVAKLSLLKLSASTPEDNAVDFNYQHKGLQVAPLPSPLVADLLPQDTQVNLLISHIPYDKLMDSAGIILQELDKAEKEAEAAKQQPATKGAPKNESEEPENAYSKMASSTVMTQVVAIKNALIEAGTTFDIKALNFKAHSLGMDSSGSFKMVMSPLAVAGTYTARVNGLDELVERLTKETPAPVASDKPQPQESPVDQGMIMGLAMAQGMGQQVEGSSPSVRSYAFELTPEAALKLNGMDLGLLGQPSAPSEAPEAPAPHKFSE